jgi:hypothetical protein
MFEQIAMFAAGSVAAIFITMITAVAVLGVYWVKVGAYNK